MELIYRSTIMKKLTKILCVMLIVFSVFQLVGCDKLSNLGKTKTEGEKADASEEENEEVTSDEKEEEKPEDGEKTEEEESAGSEEDSEEKQKEQVDKVTMAELMGGAGSDSDQEEVESLPDTILWFNATYAPLTYSNGWNWRLISGLKQTESNVEMQKALLASSWEVYDRESALETVESIKTKGHRSKCRECMEELEELGMLDISEEAFYERFMESGIEEHAGRYVIAYYMYQAGMDADAMAAWDLCRVNQLYADYYFCGYMTYEEAMDASLENSLTLQKMYTSWEDMVDSYMLGYQFWQGDLALTEDSPTLERYSYYEMLQKMEDGPYSLDWNMKLEKSW